MNEMIYDFTTHSLYYENQDVDVLNFSLAIDTLEMVFELQTGKLLRIQGFFPLIKATVCTIDFPKWKEGDYLLYNIDLSVCRENEVYDLVRKIPQTQKYFEKKSIKYDKEKGIIQVGEDVQEGKDVIKVNNNIFCALDDNLNLRGVYIMPQRFIQ